VPPARVASVLPLLLASALLAEGCQLVGGYDEFERSGPGDGGPKKSPCDALPRSKTSQEGDLLHGPLLLLIDNSYGCFWMDETEVTVGQYREWLDYLDHSGNAPPWQEQSSWCSVKGDARAFNPDLSGECQEQAASTPDPFAPRKPIRCVDWCEAEAYCAWAGKRLCKVGNPSDEWQIACSAGYTQEYPFDPSMPGGSCNYDQMGCSLGCGPREARQDDDCRPTANYPFDLGGNVEEWIDFCDVSGDGTTFCGYRGGSYLTPETKLKCSYNLGGEYWSTRDPRVGFRCCDDLTDQERALLSH